jgi:hypothetical protein
MEAAERDAQIETFPVVVGARRTIARPRTEVYGLLSDLRRHWPLLGGDLVEAGIVDGSDEASAELLLRGPFPGIERRVITRITHAEPEHAFGGEATAGRTRAAINWRLEAASEHATEVGFVVGIAPGGRRDRLMVFAARPWLHRRCEQVLSRLERELGLEVTA